MGSGLRLLVALIALSAVSAVRVEHVTRAVTIEEIVTPIYNALAASGADDIPSEEELTEWLGETMKYYTEEEKQSFVAALNEGTISAEEWKEAWEAAKSKGQEEADKEENEVARRLDPDSLSSKKHLSTPTVARPKCSPKKLLKLVRKICKKNWRCWAIWFLVDSIAELLDQLNDEPEGGGCGDPHMYGFDGSSFLFVGDLDHAFNVLSDKSIEVHTRLVAAGPKKQTYFGSFDVSSGSAHVIVHAAKSDGIMAVHLNDKRLQKDMELTQDGMQLKLSRMTQRDSQVTITTEIYKLTIMARRAHEKQHFDFKIVIVGKAIAPSGLLGATVPGFQQSELNPSKMSKAEFVQNFAVET